MRLAFLVLVCVVSTATAFEPSGQTSDQDGLLQGEYRAYLVQPDENQIIELEFTVKHAVRAALHELLYFDDRAFVTAGPPGGSRGMSAIVQVNATVQYEVKERVIREPGYGQAWIQIGFRGSPETVAFVFSYVGDTFDETLTLHRGTVLAETSGTDVWAAWPRDFPAAASAMAEYHYAANAVALGSITTTLPEPTYGFFEGRHELGGWTMIAETEDETRLCPCIFDTEPLAGDATFHLNGGESILYDTPVLWLVSPVIPE